MSPHNITGRCEQAHRTPAERPNCIFYTIKNTIVTIQYSTVQYIAVYYSAVQYSIDQTVHHYRTVQFVHQSVHAMYTSQCSAIYNYSGIGV